MAYFMMAPTLRYQLSYPRSNTVRKGWVLRQIGKLLVFVGLMGFITEQGNNIAAMALVTIPEDPIVIPEAMNNEPMVQSNTATWALTTLVQEQQLPTPEVVEISNEERADNETAGVNTDIDDLGGGNGSEQQDDDDFHAPSTNAEFTAFAIPACKLRIWTQSLIKLALRGQEMGKQMWSHVQYAWKHGRALEGICSLACGHLFRKSCIKH
ncbi:unnamed protein product [Sphagnum troendelagicum]|uniref:diacylglycerol O-acyltransferase n=1 Tax=Sphagnum troendelagicum TaxID=128251 RepID=A0ABP0UUL0_9BRYO